LPEIGGNITGESGLKASNHKDRKAAFGRNPSCKLAAEAPRTQRNNKLDADKRRRAWITKSTANAFIRVC